MSEGEGRLVSQSQPIAASNGRTEASLGGLDIDDLKSRALWLRDAAERKAASLSRQMGGLAGASSIRDGYMDAVAMFAESVVAVLEASATSRPPTD